MNLPQERFSSSITFVEERNVSIKLKTRGKAYIIKKTKKHKSCNVDFAKNKNTCIFAIANVRIWS